MLLCRFDQPVRNGGDVPSEDKKVELALALNTHRRQLTPAQRQEVGLKLKDRGWSLRRIAKALGVSHMTVKRDFAPVTDVTVPRPKGPKLDWYQAKVAESQTRWAVVEADAEMMAGRSRTLVRGQNGLEVEVHRITMEGGREARRQLVSDDCYPPLNEVVAVGMAGAE